MQSFHITTKQLNVLFNQFLKIVRLSTLSAKHQICHILKLVSMDRSQVKIKTESDFLMFYHFVHPPPFKPQASYNRTSSIPE